MTILKTQLNPRSADFQANAAAMETVVADLHEKVDKIALGGPEAARQKHLARGKLLPRERVNGLLDPGTPFLEIGQFAAYGMYGGDVPAASVIAGIGRVEGRRSELGEPGDGRCVVGSPWGWDRVGIGRRVRDRARRRRGWAQPESPWWAARALTLVLAPT